MAGTVTDLVAGLSMWGIRIERGDLGVTSLSICFSVASDSITSFDSDNITAFGELVDNTFLFFRSLACDDDAIGFELACTAAGLKEVASKAAPSSLLFVCVTCSGLCCLRLFFEITATPSVVDPSFDFSRTTDSSWTIVS
jgi:hypothetical protein